MGEIVVGVDGSDSAAGALRWAMGEAPLRGSTVTAVLAWTFLAQHHADRRSDFDPEYSEADAAQALDAFVLEALGDGGASVVRREVVCERVAPALLEAAKDADLLVLAPRGMGGFRGLLVGSTSQQCLHHATCPIAVVHPGTDGSDPTVGRGIVVGVDGSDASRVALAWALDEARARQCPVEVVHSWIAPYAYGFPAAVPLDPTVYAEVAERVVADAVDACDTSGLPSEVETYVVAGGSAVGALLDRAVDADLVVVGSHGVGGFRGMLLGSVAHHLAQHSPCPLVVVPSPR